MTLYIHGFGGSGEGYKAKAFRAYFKEDFLAPSLSYVPDLAILTLKEIIEYALQKEEEVYLIGSSLGGYYTLYLSHIYNLKAVLLNPSIYPYKTLKELPGFAPNFYDNSKFECKKEHLDMLKKYEVDLYVNQQQLLLLCQKGDELLDYKQAVEKLPHARQIIEEGGNHGFENIESKFETIESFFKESF